MEFRKLGSLDVPAIGMGTYRSFDVRSEGDIEARRRIIANCVSSEVKFIDSSPMYGNAERVIGMTTEGLREKFQLATKVWTQGKAEGEAQIARSFELMKTDFIEVLQVHNLLDWRTHLTTLERLKERGKIGLIGITHMVASDYPEMMKIMKTGRVDTVQVPYNVVNRAVEPDLLPLAEELGIGVIVMEPLEKGRLVNTGVQLNAPSRQPDLSPLAEFGIRTWAQALLAWVISDSRITTAIPATSRPERIIENAHAGSVGRLPQELRDYVREETERRL